MPSTVINEGVLKRGIMSSDKMEIEQLISYGCNVHEIQLMRRLNFFTRNNKRMQYYQDFYMYEQFEI
jgi:hypothetical protein